MANQVLVVSVVEAGKSLLKVEKKVKTFENREWAIARKTEMCACEDMPRGGQKREMVGGAFLRNVRRNIRPQKNRLLGKGAGREWSTVKKKEGGKCEKTSTGETEQPVEGKAVQMEGDAKKWKHGRAPIYDKRVHIRKRKQGEAKYRENFY